MKYNPNIHHRRSIRLREYDYSQAGAYFVTICVHNKECLFGCINADQMHLNDAGETVQTVWNDLPVRYPDIELNAFIIMPNHVHGIINIVGAGLALPDADARQQQGARQRQGAASGAPTLGDVTSRVTTQGYPYR
jgi:hypothetical protein